MIEEISRLYHTENATASMKAHVTFEEFIKYVVEERQFKRHWSTIENLCQPCQINYDYIGKHETFTEDLANIIMKFRNRTFDDAKHFVPHANQSPGKASAELADDFMKNVSVNLRDLLHPRLKRDYALFDYKFRW